MRRTNMRCDEAREMASAWVDGELPEGQARELAAHIAGCSACRALTVDIGVFAAEIADLGRDPPPEGLEARVRAALADAWDVAPVRVWAPARWRGAARWRGVARWRGFARNVAAMAAVCVLSVFGTWSALRPVGTPMWVSAVGSVSMAPHDAVAAHMRALLQDSPIQVPSSDSHTVRPWFNGKVEFAPPVKDLTAEGFQLAGGRLDFIDGHRVATLVYKRRLHTISVFVWPEGRPAETSAAQISGLNLLTWRHDGLVWWAVSDLDAEELAQLSALL